jgi:hypothetical protein
VTGPGRSSALAPIAVIGGMLLAVSSVVPWSSSQSLSAARISPLGTSALRPSAVLVLCIGFGGAVAWANRRATAAWVGLAGMLWLTFAMFVWVVGARLQLFLPSSVIPSGAVMAMEPGLLAGLLGSAALVAVAILDALIRDGSECLSSVQLGPLLVALAVVAGVWWGFGASWFKVEVQGSTWTVGLDAAPVVGELIAILVIVMSVLVIWTAATPRRVIVNVVIAGGLLLAAVAAGLAVSGSVMSAAVARTLRSVGLVELGDSIRISGGGPWILVASSLSAVLYVLVRHRLATRDFVVEMEADVQPAELPY